MIDWLAPPEALTEEEARTFMEDRVLRRAAEILRQRAERQQLLKQSKPLKALLKRCEKCGAYKLIVPKKPRRRTTAARTRRGG